MPHVRCDKTGKWLFVANYDSGSVVCFGIEPDGQLSAEPACFIAHDRSLAVGHNPERQERPHAHQVVISDDNRFLYVL